MKKVKLIVFLMIFVLCLSSCNKNETIDINSNSSNFGETTQESISFTDSLGRQITLNNKPEKVTILSGSYADIWKLGGGSVYATTKDALTENIISPDDNISIIGDLKTPSIENIISSNSDFIILSSKIDSHISLQEQLNNIGINYAYFEVENFEDYLYMLKIVSDINNRPDLYQINGESIKEQIDAELSRKDENYKPEILFIRAFSTGAKAKNSDNNMTASMLNEFGCINIADSDSSLLEDLSMEAIIQHDPEYIFVITMGESEEKALSTMNEMFMSNPAWASLSAVKNNNFHILPKELFHLKPNSRWAESYKILADILYKN